MPRPLRNARLPRFPGLLFAVLLGFTAACAEGGPDGGEDGGSEANGTGEDEVSAREAAAPSAEEPAVASQRPEAESPFTLGRSRTDLTVGVPVPATATVGEDDEYLLLLDGLVLLAPGAFYQVYLNLPEGTEPDPQGPYFVGNLSLFGPTAEQMEEGEEPPRHSQSFDVSDQVRELASRGGWDGEVQLTLVRGNPAPATAADQPEAFIRVGEVSVIHPE